VRRIGLASVLAIGACLAGVPGCHHEAPPAVAPDEHPPLPPASGTPVGYLLDAGELTLHGDQRAELEAIDDDLAGRLAALDGASRAGRPGPGPAPGGHGGRHRGGRRGGMAGGPGRGGGMAGGGAGSGAAAGGRGPAGPAAAPDPGLAAGPGGDTRAAEVRAAVARALAVLDADQQVIARRVLTEHGVAFDSGPGPGRAPAGDSDDSDGDGDGDGDPSRSGSGSPR